MIEPRLFLCGGAVIPESDPSRVGRRVVELNTQGVTPNVNVRLEDVAKIFLKDLSPRLLDLLEIAAYVFSADCATARGSEWTDDAIEPWERDFKFIIPVRDLTFWSQDKVNQLLVQVLSFLSNDIWAFDFCPLTQDDPGQNYLELGDLEEWPFYGVDRVLMFSGGLDSLAGATEMAALGNKLVLVSHRSVSTMDKRQRQLFGKLKSAYPNQVVHVPVWINKAKTLGREHTQRTRSFLFSALGTVVAESVKAGGVRFFENGIVSLNLPIADEVLRARASRTTHPIALELFANLYTMVTERSFIVDNPYLFKTKPEVVAVIAERGMGHLIPYTCSCPHSFFRSRTQWHCGTCSQCIDRRIAIIAAGQEDNDPQTDYVSDVFTGPRKEGYERNMAVGYARHSLELNRMSETEIASKFNTHLTRAVRYLPKKREAAERLVEMHKRHGETVTKVLNQQLQKYSSELIKGQLDKSSMLALVAGQAHLTSSWSRYAERMAGLLSTGVPTACKTHKPKNEPHLQEICDGILKAHDGDLIREFPFMRWSSSLTKPDWSDEHLGLFVELKYVRKKEDILPVTKAIAEDITKYGDNSRRVLYVIYDPVHLITDERAFSEPILKRQDMLVHFIR